MSGVIEPSEHDQKFLREERDRIKSQLYAEYGDTIKKMMDEQSGPVAASPVEERHRHLHDMISNRTPLRQQVASAQDEAIKRLIEDASAAEARGEKVSDRLTMLMSMKSPAGSPQKEEQQPSSE